MLRRDLLASVAGGIVVGAACASPDDLDATPGPEIDPDRPAGARAFDFLWGRWDVSNRVLTARLAGADTWNTWPATLLVRPMLHGYGNIDWFEGAPGGQRLAGSTLRLFDPGTGEWSLYWMDTTRYRLMPQVSGAMTDDGYFYGEEPFQDRTVRLRFAWTVTDEDHAHWEQAYAEPGTDDWETNWTMDFTRSG